MVNLWHQFSNGKKTRERETEEEEAASKKKCNSTQIYQYIFPPPKRACLLFRSDRERAERRL
jgi:hypothetical protein